MLQTPLTQKALAFATTVHQNQTRKGTHTPYIEHPVAVAEILSEIRSPEHIVAAGLLHDVVEDCEPYGCVTVAILSAEFGSQVAQIVNDLTEQDKSLPWEVRKRLALEHIREMAQDSRLVKAADVLHNLRALVAALRTQGSPFWQHFNASEEAIIANYEKRITTILNVEPNHPLGEQLLETMGELQAVNPLR